MNADKVWGRFVNAAICMMLSASVILGFGVRAEAEAISKNTSLLNKESSLKTDTASKPADGINFQMAISKYPIETNNVNSVDNRSDFVIDGMPVFYSGSTIFFNVAAPIDSIEVVGYAILVKGPDGSERYYNEEEASEGKYFTNWYDCIEATLVEEGIWTFYALIECSDGTIYTDALQCAILYDREDQIIYANSSYTKAYGVGGFGLNAKTSGTGTLSYKSSNTKVVTVSSVGWVNITGYGEAKITITAAKNNSYYSASKTVTVKIIPDTVRITKITSPSKGKISCTWGKVPAVTGYEMQLSYAGKSFTLYSKKNSTKGSAKSKKKYSVKVRAYKSIDGKKYYGNWSKTKTVKIK